MPRLIVIDIVGALTAVVLWYCWFARYNRRRAIRVLKWVQTACAERGRVTKVCWAGSSRLLAELRDRPTAVGPSPTEPLGTHVAIRARPDRNERHSRQEGTEITPGDC